MFWELRPPEEAQYILRTKESCETKLVQGGTRKELRWSSGCEPASFDLGELFAAWFGNCLEHIS